MHDQFDSLKQYLADRGSSHIPHSGTNFLAHLVGVQKLLEKWDCPEHIVLAGVFHSVYGATGLKNPLLPISNRHEVCSLIGERAEQLVYWFECWHSGWDSSLVGSSLSVMPMGSCPCCV
jgi:hypothetical protein